MMLWEQEGCSPALAITAQLARAAGTFDEGTYRLLKCSGTLVRKPLLEEGKRTQVSACLRS